MKVTVKIERSDGSYITGKFYLGIYTAAYDRVLRSVLKCFYNTHFIMDACDLSHDDGTNEAYVNFDLVKLEWYHGAWCARPPGAKRPVKSDWPLTKTFPFAEALSYSKIPKVNANKFASLVSHCDLKASDFRKIFNWIFKSYSTHIVSHSHSKKVSQLIEFSSTDEPGDPKLFGEAPNPLQYELNLSCAEQIKKLQDKAGAELRDLEFSTWHKIEAFKRQLKNEMKDKKKRIKAECIAKIRELRSIQEDAYALS